MGAGSIGRQRNIVNITDAQQSLNVRLMRVGIQRINQKDHTGDAPFRHTRRNLRVTAIGAAQHSFHR